MLEYVNLDDNDIEKYIFELRKSFKWDLVTLREHQKKYLRNLLFHAKKKSKYYRSVLKSIDIDSIDLSNINQIPIMTKEIMMEHWDDIVTDKQLSLGKIEKHLQKMRIDPQLLCYQDNYHVLVTSGSSGKRGIFVYNQHEWKIYYAMFHRYGYKKQNNLFKKITIAILGVEYQIYGIVALANTVTRKLTNTMHVNMLAPIDNTIKLLNDTEPDVLQSNPSFICQLATLVLEGVLRINPSIISVGAQVLLESQRHLILKAWPQADIYNTYGASEGIAGVVCKGNAVKMHLNEDLCVIEPVDRENLPVMKQKMSDKILLTNLFNYTFPLIRYEIPDKIQFLDEQCQCGVTHQLIAEPGGRSGLEFIYNHGLLVSPIVFSAELLLEPKIIEYQVFQTDKGASIHIMVNGYVNIPHLTQRIVTNLTRIGLVNPEINFRIVEKLQYLESGKLQRFICGN